MAVAQPPGITPRQTEGAPAARLARWALRAVIAAKIQAADGNRFTPAILKLPAGSVNNASANTTWRSDHDDRTD